MNTLPIWAQITIGILSVGFIANIITVITILQKYQELKGAKLQRLNDNLLQNTRPHIDTLYIPITKILAKLEAQYDEYKIALARCHGYEVKKSIEVTEDAPENQASIELAALLYSKKYDATLALSTVCKELMDYQEKMIVKGTIAYLTTEFEERLDSFVRFLYGVGIISHTYLLPSKEVSKEQPKVYTLGTSEFEKEFYAEIDYIRTYVRELALGTTDTIKSLSKKSLENNK